MNKQAVPVEEASNTTPTEHIQAGWGFWTLWVLGLAAAGAMSYCLGSFAPWATLTLPPASMIIFGLLAGGVQGFALRRQIPPARWWLLSSALAGYLAAGIGLLSTAPAETSPGLFAGWAYAWAAYGAVLGVALLRLVPSRWWMLASLAGWATAGIVSGAVGWALAVFQVTETIPTTAFYDLPSRTWSISGLAVVGGVCGATGGAITGVAWIWMTRVRAIPERVPVRKAMDSRLVNIAGIACGLLAAVSCTYVAPLAVTALLEGSLESVDLTIYFLGAIYRSPICIPAMALVTIPLAIGCGYAGLEMARAGGRTDPRLWVWSGAAVGGVAGYLLGSLVAFAIAHMAVR